MKKMILVLCVFTCLLSFTACSNSGDSSKTQEASEYITEETMKSISTALIEQISSLSKEQIQKLIDTPNIQISQTTEEAVVYKGFYKTWLSIISELGSYMEFKDFEYSVDKHDVFGKMTLVFEKGNAEFIMTANEESMNVTGIQLTQNQTLGEKIKNAGLNTLMGMGTVFIVLIFIAFLISLFKYINKAETYFANRKLNKKSQDIEVIDTSKAPVVLDIIPEAASEVEETKLVAVITAAVAASLNTSTDKLVVRSIRRMESNQWQRN